MWILLFYIILNFASVSRSDKSKVRGKSEVKVGYFNIAIPDNRFDSSGIDANETLINETEYLWSAQYQFWLSYYDDKPLLDQINTASRNSEYYLSASTGTNYTKWLNETALDCWQQQQCSFGMCPMGHDDPNFDYTSYYLDVLQNLTDMTYWYSNIVGPASYFSGLWKPISAIHERGHIKISEFTLSVRDKITDLAEIKHPISLDKLQTWSQNPDDPSLQSSVVSDGPTQDAQRTFSRIRAEVDDWKNRRHWWRVPAYFVASVQIVMFAVAILPLLFTIGVPRFLLRCQSSWTGYYLAISATVNALFRLAMWESGYHERVKIYALSDVAKKSLDALLKRTEGDGCTKVANTETELPPLYGPLLERCLDFCIHVLNTALAVFSKSTKPYESRPLVHDLENNMRAFTRKFKGQPTSTLKYLHEFLPKKLQETTQSPSARRWRPVIVLLHLGQEGRSTIYTLFTGYVEAMLLLVLTLFFAAHWGGNLYVTFIALIIVVLFITAGRALGVIYVMISSRLWGLHIVHCGSDKEIMGSLRIICSMRDVLVIVNGATYYKGYKLKGRQIGDKPGFEEWRESYDKGDYDKENDLPHEDQRSDDDEASQPLFHEEACPKPTEEMTTSIIKK
ncbi:MAG: hypothetical protein Q9227_009160 [Pyrenula ochraceoflavens]